MENYTIISREQLNELLEAEEKSGRDFLDWNGYKDFDGKMYCSIWKDTRTGTEYAVKALKSVHMGFNSNEEGKVEELIRTVEQYGEASASWGVTGRTMHSILAEKLADELPQYRFEIGYNYQCDVYKI